ncbi:MAG: ribonuclease III [Chitinophagales bacterium]|nr:ribonuclease III [Chitinophagales bacterium]MCB9031661.1 ribonuclease III [Chitinophagales bacterium]HPR28955.1 ribonuclease III [Chitinophagales bacterium]HQU40108.1 ribonuclease III [Chitinophagales bacterium]
MSFYRKLYNLYFSDEKGFVRRIRSITGFTPVNTSLYHLALQHSSVHNSVHMNNERLELLGDSVIDLVITDHLFKKYPFKTEGFLTEMRSKVVSRDQLNRVALKLGLEELIRVRKGVGDLMNSSVLGNALEALTGALYLDQGYHPAAHFFRHRILAQHYNVEELENLVINFKSKVIEWAQKNGHEIRYELLEEHEAKGKKIYQMGLMVNGELIASDSDFSKKRAEQKASEHACKKLGVAVD